MKKALILLIIVALVFALFGCVKAEGVSNGNGYVSIYVDRSTGVNYFIARNYDHGINMCPRYNADGTLYVSEV